MKKKNKYYWDSSVFIALIMNEDRTPAEKQGLNEAVTEIDAGRATLITSIQTDLEVLDADLTEKQKKLYDSSLKKPTTVRVNTSHKVIGEARKIIDFYRRQSPKIVVKQIDAIHLATALLHEVDELHTYDEDMLRFDRNLMGHNIRIRRPSTDQTSLPLLVNDA